MFSPCKFFLSSKRQFAILCFVSLFLVFIYQLFLQLEPGTLRKVHSELVYFAEKYRFLEPSWIHAMKPIPVNNLTANCKIILLYTPYFRSMPWSQTKGMEFNLPCRVSTCCISYSRQDLHKSDAVLFHYHSHLMPWDSEITNLLSHRRKGQKWVWFTEESPVNSDQTQIARLNNMMDITITYHRKSTILSLYGHYSRDTSTSRVKQIEKQLKENSFSSGKDRLILWFASNCVTPRLDIVKSIAKYIQVDVYGGCKKYFNNQSSGQCGKYSSECHALTKRYKFYLAIENSQCEHYVTEKYWRTLSRGLVPVVVAGKYNKDIMIPGSYIDILDFRNAKYLANYLRYLDSNDTAYNMYFQWKKNYSSADVPSWICDLCEFLRKNRSNTNLKWDIGKFWGIENNCQADEEYIKTVWLKSQGSLSYSFAIFPIIVLVLCVLFISLG